MIRGRDGVNVMYESVFKRWLDIFVSGITLLVLFPVLLVLIITGTIMMKGNPFFVQPRPGQKDKTGKEKIFNLIKFRTMNNARGTDGQLLPDEQRLGKYGKWLRSTSLDELPSLINIFKGDLSVVGPRPQLVRDMVFMTPEQRRRHDVPQGLTGLAQINGRNNISWEKKFEYDLLYIENGITFMNDMKIIFQTIGKVLKRSDVVREGTASDMDFGDWLMKHRKVDQATYDAKQVEARELLKAQF